MTPIRKNSPEMFAKSCTQEVKTNYFFSLQCNKKPINQEQSRTSKIFASSVEMYLRISPASVFQKNYIVLDTRTLLTTFQPFEDKFTRNSRCAKSSEAEGRRHVFTKIFGSETSQAEMFEGSIKHRVVEFLSGKSSTIMTYGMRDSGKTYTLFGTSSSPGIITRSIELVFSAINCTIAPWYKPTFQDTVFCLNETARALEMQRKIRVLNGQSTNVNQISAEAKTFLENSQPGNPDKSEECDSESMYAVWLSFAEIYNGNIYDLLDDAETRSPLKLYMNTEGRAVCSLQKVHALTALEACQILMAGESRMSVTTGSEKSRSHTIFTMKLLKYQKDHAAEEVILSTLTFCDLAGSTQFKKSRMREGSSINNSLLVLGRCVKAVSQNRMAPFRQSNLTRMCQRALSGEENLSFIVNVVFQSSLFDEIQSILNFCDIVRKLTNYHKECKQICEFEETIRDLETFDNTMTSSSNYQSPCEIAETIGCTDSLECRNIREQNRRLKQELETVKSDMLNCEYTIRQQLADHYLRMIEELEGTYKENTKKIETEGEDLLKWSIKQVESFYKERIDNLMQHKKRKRGNSGDYIEDSHTLYEELKAENAQVTSKVMVLKEVVKKLKQENKTILCEKNKYSFELALVTEELKKFRQLTRAGIRKWGGNTENIEDDADCLMNNLERLMDEKVKRTEEKLEEMSEYIRVIENKDAETASGAKQKLSKSEYLLNNTLNKEEELLQEACIDSQNLVKENVERLEDSADLNKCNYQETVAELSQDLETIRDVIYALNEETYTNDYQMPHKEETLERLIEEKNEIGIKDDGVFKMTENKIQEYKREIYELSRKLIKVFSRCANEHLPKIENLEKELLQKTLQISEFDKRIAEMQHEFAKDYKLFQKIYDFDIIVNRCQKDKNELYTQLYECSQLTLEDKLKKLTMKMTERESEIISLKSEVRNIADLNVANNEKARNLSEQIIEADESIGLVKEDLHCCKDLRKNVENTMKAEIHNLKSRLSDQENNTTLLNEIYKTYSDSQDEITRLKMQLEHKELEITLLKTNKNASIKSYDILKHLQNEIEQKNKYFETANSSNNLERSLTENQKQSEETLKDHETKNSSASSSSFVPNHASSETLTVSSAPSEKSTTFSDEADGFGYISIKLNKKSCQTDSSVKSNVYSVCETDSSEMEDNFNMRSSDTKDKKKSRNWMKVRKISGERGYIASHRRQVGGDGGRRGLMVCDDGGAGDSGGGGGDGGGEIYTGCQPPNNVIALYKLRERGEQRCSTLKPPSAP
ncbi:SUB protein, partial [Acromyrmex heyeri]